jgi:hypothetical protein
MTKDFPQNAKDLSHAIAVLRKGATEPLQGFSALAKAASKAGALDEKTKN